MCCRTVGLAAVGVVVGICWAATPLFGGSVVMRDGRQYEGTLKLDGQQVVIKTVAGIEIRVGLDAIQQAIFKQGTAAAAAQDGPKSPDKPAENPKPVQGLRAEYFGDMDLKNLRLVRIDPNIDFYWSDEAAPDPAVPDNFSARWTGLVDPAYSETYTFYLHVNDHGRFWVNGRLIIDRWTGEPGEFQGTIDLKAGQRVEIKVEFQDVSYAGSARLSWSSKHQDRQIVPSVRLFPPAGTKPPTVRLLNPADRSLVLVSQSVAMEAEATDDDGMRRVEFYAGEKLVGSASASPWRIEWKAPEPGWHVLRAKATNSTGVSATSAPAWVAVTDDAGGTLPRPWGQMPVGSRDVIGSARFEGDAFSIESHRGDLWGEQDVFHYVVQRLHGDGAFVARLQSFEHGDEPGAAAGLLIREHLMGSGARQAFLGFVPDSGIVYMRRENVWEDRKSIEDPGRLPCWLKLVRHGKLMRAYRSEDGASWQLLGERKTDLPEDVYLGLAVADPAAGRAVFDHVSVTSGSPAIQSTIKGILLRSGSVIAGNVHRADETSVKMWHKNGEVVVPTGQVARILFKPLTAETAERITPGRTGAILGSGDFVDGSVSFRDGSVYVNSVLFGAREFNIWDETVALVLNEAKSAPCQYIVRAADGSVIRARSLEAKGDRLRVIDPLDVQVIIQVGDLLDIARSQ